MYYLLEYMGNCRERYACIYLHTFVLKKYFKIAAKISHISICDALFKYFVVFDRSPNAGCFARVGGTEFVGVGRVGKPK
jgi:hypothetical protein